MQSVWTWEEMKALHEKGVRSFCLEADIYMPAHETLTGDLHIFGNGRTLFVTDQLPHNPT